MLTQRTNPHFKPALVSAPAQPRAVPITVPVPSMPKGDIIYGAANIAAYLFPEEDHGKRARRRIYNLWSHYSARKERAGFFKMKGALCLSKSQWAAYHGLGS